MPDGAQAWKMIKIPGSHTDRVTQACDWCRTKKIRCDGQRPQCSQCQAVGFECKISDKLTRRAFPRGYTESLEYRIRQLESENVRLSSLLDVKDEQMETLSRVEALQKPTSQTQKGRPQPVDKVSPHTHQMEQPALSVSPGSDASDDDSNYVVDHMNTLAVDDTYRGTTAGGVFLKSFIDKLQIKNPQAVPAVSKIVLQMGQSTDPAGMSFARASSTSCASGTSMDSPPGLTPDSSISRDSSSLLAAFPSRLVCDKLLTIYFQEWQSMYAVVDEVPFLTSYQKFFDTDMTGTPVHPSTELFASAFAIILSLASLSVKDGTPLTANESACLEVFWKRQLAQRQMPSLKSLQVILLALLYSCHVGNLNDIWHYRSMATTMVLRLGLHRSRHLMRDASDAPLSDYTKELSRRLFWLTYTLDVFASIMTGSPRTLPDSQIDCSMPQCIGQDVLIPEEERKADSCQVSLIHLSRVLANIIDTLYVVSETAHSHKVIVQLEDQLESWKRHLPSSLRFEFVNGSPSASLGPVHQKSPLLLMLYHYGRILIHLPAVTASHEHSSTHGSASNVAAMNSAKTYIQVFNYLKFRDVTSTLPLSMTRTIFLTGSIVLFGAVDYTRGGALLQQTRKLVTQAISHLYTDMQLDLPGSVTMESFLNLETVCDIVFNGSSLRHSSGSSGSGERRRARSSVSATLTHDRVEVEQKEKHNEPKAKLKVEPKLKVLQPQVELSVDPKVKLEETDVLDDIFKLQSPWVGPEVAETHAEPSTCITMPYSPPAKDFFDPSYGMTLNHTVHDSIAVADPKPGASSDCLGLQTETDPILDGYNWDDAFTWGWTGTEV